MPRKVVLMGRGNSENTWMSPEGTPKWSIDHFWVSKNTEQIQLKNGVGAIIF